jgi:hypothetical protein
MMRGCSRDISHYKQKTHSGILYITQPKYVHSVRGNVQEKCTQGEQNNSLTKKMDPLCCSFLEESLSIVPTNELVRDKSL